MTPLIQIIVGQIVALAAFFAFPVVRYILLKRISKRDGKPELWYLPDYGFRIVIRNLSGKRTLSGIHHQAIARRIIPASSGASVATYQDEQLSSRSDFFVFSGVDQVLLSFRLEGSSLTARA